MGPYCDFCASRCFQYSKRRGGLLATCEEGQRHDRERFGFCWNDVATPNEPPTGPHAEPADALVWRRSADALAYAVAKLVESGQLDSRSAASDRLLDYLQVGSLGGPDTVCQWVERYERYLRATQT